MWGSESRPLWTLQRFGLTPARLVRRFGDTRSPSVLLVSVPKAGTHLLERALCLHPALHRKLTRTLMRKEIERTRGGVEGLAGAMRPGQIVVAHLEFDRGDPEILARHGVRSLFMIRDPRDVLVSIVHFAVGRRNFEPGEAYRSLPDLKDRIALAIEGRPQSKIPSIRDRLLMYRGWLHSDALVVRFEALIGAAGGGERDRQMDTLRAIFDHLGVPTSEERLADICRRVFSSASPTFRRGTVGGFREVFDEELLQRFEEAAGDLAAEYGYPLKP